MFSFAVLCALCFGSAFSLIYNTTDILTVATPLNPDGVTYDSLANNFVRPWNDTTLWMTGGNFVLALPSAGDEIVADFSTTKCFCSRSGTKTYHAAASIDGYTTPQYASVTLSGSQSRCRATVHIYPTGVLNADTIVVKSGVQLVLEGQIRCKNFTLEKGAVIFGNGIVDCASVQIRGDVAIGWMFFDAAAKLNKAVQFTIEQSTDCAPSYGYFSKLARTYNTSLGQRLSFVGGTVTVDTGDIWIDFDGFTPPVTNEVFFDAVYLKAVTVHPWQPYSFSANYSLPCIFFNSLTGPANVTTQITNFTLTPFLPWVDDCRSKCGSRTCNQINCYTMSVSPQCSGGCQTNPGGSCVSPTATSLSVFIAADALPPGCAANSFFAPATTGISLATTTGNGTGDSTTAAATTAQSGSGGLSTTAIIVLAVILPTALVVALGFGILIWWLRKRELASRKTEFAAKQMSKFTD